MKDQDQEDGERMHEIERKSGSGKRKKIVKEKKSLRIRNGRRK